MKAFGSFAKKTEVPFSDFARGLYLVVGETGAGKTTIFDAIVFALFGAASGTNRKPDMMHSDYVEKSEDTEVCLVFDHNGKRYTVTRTIHFTKKRGTENEYGDGKLSADLILPEGRAVSGHAAVTRRCEELLGLNADQFRKIVMLAQGEFREFLAADSGKKSEILGKLFDSSAYVRYQTLLGSARAALDAKRKQYRESVDAVMRATFRMPEEEDDGFLYHASNPQLIDNLDRLIERDTERATGLAERKAAAQKAVDEINTRKGAAESNNQKLDELFAAREHDEKLNAQRGDMETLTEQCARAQKALHKVCPARDKYAAAAVAVERARAELAALRAKEAELRDGCETARANVEGDADAKARVIEIDAERRRIAESLPRYDALAEKQSALDAETKAAEALQNKLNAAEEQRGKSRAALDAGQAELQTLENADADAVRAQARYEQAKKDAEEWRGVRNDVNAVKREETALASDEAELSGLAASAAEAEDAHHRKYQAFLGGQAGLMAVKLEQDLEKNGRALCPVCHTEHRTGEAHDFARCIDGTPTQAEVDAAKKEYDKREKARAAQQSVVERKRADLSSRRETLVTRAGKLLPNCDGWETLAGDGYLADAADRFDLAEKTAKRACGDARQKQVRKAELKENCDTLTKTLETLAREIDDGKAAQSETEKRVASLRAEAESMKSHLPFGTRAEAEAKQGTLDEERAALDERINAHQRALDAAKEAIDTARGELAGKEKALPEQETAAATAKSDYEAALAANGFAGEAALTAALAPIGGADGEEWLARQREAINAYRNDCANTAERITALTEQTKELRYTDLEELKKELGAAGEQRDAAEQAYAEQEKRLDNHRGVRETASAALRELAKTNRAWSRLDKLADLALGANAEGGKLSFERYVMGTIFKEVLDMANRRLDVMSGGRYSLEHSLSASRANAAAGLEIEVMDVATGKQRAANSLSGGESFQVSLSLALGLSDVVQGHAGGIGLDTIFIDEGFGALDGGALDNAITVLDQLTEGNRLVGIISHVDKLEASIPQKLRVKKTAHGSELRSELS